MLPVATTVATRHPPVATWSIIGLNVAVFMVQMSIFASGGEPALKAFLHEWGLVPARYFVAGWAEAHGLAGANFLPFLTNTFLHGGLMHLLFNMWTLYIFGPAVEDRMGPVAYVLFYLACGIGASFAHAIMNPASELPAIGASGAIAGVSGAFIRLFPKALVVIMVPVLFFPFFFEMHAIAFAGIWLLIQTLQGITALFMPANVGGVAWWAHIGGFIVGWWAATPWLRKPRGRAYQPDEGKFGCCPDGRRNRLPGR
jgi:membrane associated rhomboid family serine protease